MLFLLVDCSSFTWRRIILQNTNHTDGHTIGDISSQWKKAKFTPLIKLTPLNRQSPNIAHVITSTMSAHMPHLVKVAPVVTFPHIAKVTTQFYHATEMLPLTKMLCTGTTVLPAN